MWDLWSRQEKSATSGWDAFTKSTRWDLTISHPRAIRLVKWGKELAGFLPNTFNSLDPKISLTSYDFEICYASIFQWLRFGLFVAYRVQRHKHPAILTGLFYAYRKAECAMRLPSHTLFSKAEGNNVIFQVMICWKLEASDFTMAAPLRLSAPWSPQPRWK